MTFVLDMIYYIIVLVFGVMGSACFAGIKFNKKTVSLLLIYCGLTGILQILLSHYLSLEFAKQLYPLTTHLPLLLFLVLVLKCKFLISIVSILSAYLCCQIPWWCAHFFNLFFDNQIAYTLVYGIVAGITFYVLYKYISEPIARFMKHSQRAAHLLGIVPLFYYLFDYSTTIYTDWLYSGNKTAVQFMPSILAFFYFVFIVVYYNEITLEEEARFQADTLTLQLNQSAIYLDNIRKLQEQTTQYRHDIRHHLRYINSLVSAGNIDEVKKYINCLENDITAITPKTFCKKELVNVILCYFYKKASDKKITMDINAYVPSDLDISETKLCAILSNLLDNAIISTEKVADKSIEVRLSMRGSSLLIQVSNPYRGTI